MRAGFSILGAALWAVGCAHTADDGLPAPETGDQYLHEQFARARARMDEPYILAGEDTLLLFRTFRYQLQRLGDERFAAALAAEKPDVIAAVRGFIEPSSPGKEYPRTRALLRTAPRKEFAAERVTREDAERP